jgi:hypothetical protein
MAEHQSAFDTLDSSAPPPDVLTGSVGKGDAPPKSLDDMTGSGDAQYDAITKADLALTTKKIGAEAGMEAQRKRSDDAYAARQERMLAQEGATMEDLKPWNAAKELNSRKTDLWEQFGSPGFIVAMLASTFTAMPMNSALNAGAAAMNAINQNDMDSYNKAFDAWKENSNLTIKRLDIEEHEFEQIDHLRAKNMESWRASASALAARFNDQRMQIMLANGYNQQALEARDALAKSKVELSDATQRLQENEIRRQVTMALLGDSKDPKKMAQAAADAEMITTAPKTPEQMAVNAVISQPGFRDLPNTDQNKQIQDAIRGIASARIGGRGTPAALETNRRLDEWDQSNPQASKEERDAAHLKIINEVSSANKATTTLTKEDADFVADQYLAGDRQAASGFARSAQNMAMVRRSIREKAQDQHMTGAELAMKIAEFHGIVSAETATGRRTATIGMFANETKRVIEVAKRASKDVPRGEFIPFNQAMLAFEKQTGDPKVVALGAALNAVINTYAKAINGGQQGTVSDKDHAREVLELAYSDNQMDAVYNIMQQELQAAIDAPGDVKQSLRDLQSGKVNPAPSDPNIIRYDANGNRLQ